jgi:hypothetical protein
MLLTDYSGIGEHQCFPWPRRLTRYGNCDCPQGCVPKLIYVFKRDFFTAWWIRISNLRICSTDFAGEYVSCSRLIQNGMRDRNVSTGIDASAFRWRYAFSRSRKGFGGGIKTGSTSMMAGRGRGSPPPSRSSHSVSDSCSNCISNDGDGTPSISLPHFQHKSNWSRCSSPHLQHVQLIS